MSRQISRGHAGVRKICQVFRISRQTYYAALRAPESTSAVRPRRERQGD